MKRNPREQLAVPIDKNRRILKEGRDKAYQGMAEYYNRAIGSRVLRMEPDSEQVRVHEILAEHRVPVFSSLYGSDDVFLLVPEGSRLVRNIVRLIARDVDNYGEVFQQLGGAIGATGGIGLGAPVETDSRTLLESFAYGGDEREAFGGSVYLVPPYRLNTSRVPADELPIVRAELEEIGALQPADVDILVDKTWKGIAGV